MLYGYEVHRYGRHKETISIAVMNSAGKLVMTLLQFVQGLRGNLQVTDESELDKRNNGGQYRQSV